MFRSAPETLRIAGVVRESVVDGPGLRYVIFAQGCPHHCKGCHNPETWDPAGGYEITAAELLADISRNPLLKGVTFSGGDPFLQAGAFAVLGRALREEGYNIVTYTGYTYEELQTMAEKGVRELLAVTDILIDGPFVLAERDLTLPFRGSKNQRIIDVRASRAAGTLVQVAV
ncbi:anaerobic ribonucleoside-triphosphate reductase activating protein [Thermodesulfitimonas autotrophica]|uniref:Anaerobic ribonucleoside-triphosphate reductase-activating protein n=1 Tax=Thermodesulfitimonas autotrophica TaxID=1894989 RepID=A0A3N5AWU2_9THEO|nr:anaerobic ribonucleoside-triphosphate reductase activating protein [Thermodesulfitimonas autotrophica]RPF49479.1 anaerobic ribonucleoside-triphosphate reductase activating protein [Thermodesulfitimonas autotrophica]